MVTEASLRTLYDVTGNVSDINTMLVPRLALRELLATAPMTAHQQTRVWAGIANALGAVENQVGGLRAFSATMAAGTPESLAELREKLADEYRSGLDSPPE